ncbi:MAG TPA: family 16 glycosylhydrolase [Bacteroidales bacterium]|nr:family 16 glycosylhydrolase [Bacteroidales bacterium]
MKSLFTILLTSAAFLCFSQETLLWSDEFNGSGVPDPEKWSYDLGASGWGNNEIQNYTDSYQNARMEGGVLAIEAHKYGTSWTSARLQTNNKFEFKYGRVVFRAKLPRGSGTWPALWMLGENFNTAGWPGCGEIDVMEHVGKNPGNVHVSLHTPSSHGNTVNTSWKYVIGFDTAFHTYQANWTPEKIEFSIDSVLLYTYNPFFKNASTWPFDKPFFIIMNIAMGGNWGSDPQYETGGLKNGIDPALTMARMEIDYVRVYQDSSGSSSLDQPFENGNPQDFKNTIIAPNPTSGILQIDLPAGILADGSLYNTVGERIHHFESASDYVEIDMSVLNKGLYFITLQSKGKYLTQKIIVQ